MMIEEYSVSGVSTFKFAGRLADFWAPCKLRVLVLWNYCLCKRNFMLVSKHCFVVSKNYSFKFGTEKITIFKQVKPPIELFVPCIEKEGLLFMHCPILQD